jgi:SAM-dependent methyltransferase
MQGKGSVLKRYIKIAIRYTLKKSPFWILPLDAIVWFSQRVTAKLVNILFFRDWQLESQGRPQFFKHQINIGRWPVDPGRWSFVARGVYARENMFQGCKVLDLCCGDGSYSYLFFSDIADKIDAVDNDLYAINYAMKYYWSPSIQHHRLDIINQPLPSNEYDFVVWNAAICYFEESDIEKILLKIVGAGKPSMKLTGMLPKANGWVDHKTEFSDMKKVSLLLQKYFKTVEIKQVDEVRAITFYFQASMPLDIGLIN